MRKGKPFFYRIEASDFFAETLNFKSDKDLGKFIRQFAVDLVTCSPSSPYSSQVISEATDYINKKREAGSKGGKQKASTAKASLEHSSSTGLASSSNSNSTETKEDNPLPPPPAGEAKVDPPEKVVPAYSEPVMWISKDLARRILVNNPKNRDLQSGTIEATVLRWAKDIDKMIRLDKREPREVAEVVRWCQADSFWSQNILSGIKLREQYDKLTVKMRGTALSVVPKVQKETRLDRNVQAAIEAGRLLGEMNDETK